MLLRDLYLLHLLPAKHKTYKTTISILHNCKFIKCTLLASHEYAISIWNEHLLNATYYKHYQWVERLELQLQTSCARNTTVWWESRSAREILKGASWHYPHAAAAAALSLCIAKVPGSVIHNSANCQFIQHFQRDGKMTGANRHPALNPNATPPTPWDTLYKDC